MSKIKSAIAVSKYVRMSPHKVRRILNQIRGHSCNEILSMLKFLPYKAKFPICKVVNSAITNVQNTFNVEKEKLFVTETYVNNGPKIKRLRYRAKGNSNTIIKKTCHILVKITEKN